MLSYTEAPFSLTETINDGCVIAQGIKALSNP